MTLLRIGLILKAIDALLEIVGGIMLFHPSSLNRWLKLIFQHELVRRNADHHTVVTLQANAIHAVQTASVAGAIYLIAHGITKIIFICGVLKEKKWGYLGLIAVLVIFTLVEWVHSAIGGGVAIFLFGLFDAYLAYLVWAEYRKTHLDESNSPRLSATHAET